MKFNIDRVKGFSDGFIAIIITLMILEIPIPNAINQTELFIFFKALFIYGTSFMIIAIQQKRHHYLIDDLTSISNTGICKNMLWLLSLSFIPIFMKWLIDSTFNIVPAFGYSVVCLINDFSIRFLFLQILKENPEHQIIQITQYREQFSLKHIFIFICILCIISVIALIYPRIAMICFIIFPTIMSSKQCLTDKEHEKRI